ncbi:2-amino-4-hydroxy-6-hydroxymethyldihydropteridine diphosphokinase [Bacteroides caecigallinarum]|uniref:2-amino-4-hydroxy-6- hydroxymethyldihydropteridine diphosphokinase n=1 Tax=Bacteroides caecigallinarum TaxID=1411144 RepID=UPI001F18B65E|nr:2-amino-4-hydroxy-6-hydroxymethyldihydropteridine diphosphokinase [Bacteroides caecigallinarum]
MQKNTIQRLFSNTMSSVTCIICLGSNYCPEHNISLAVRLLTSSFPHIRWGKTIVTPATGVSRPVPDYHNLAAIFTTTMSLPALRSLLKETEKACGRTPESKSTGLIPIDIDLLQYDGTILKPEDMNTAHVRQALSSLIK